MHDVVVRTLEMNARNKPQCLANEMNGGFKGGIRSSYHAEILSIAIHSNPGLMMLL